MRIDDLDTPCLLLDLDRVNKNIATMMGILEGTGVSLRPHFKTPKCPAVAELQLKAGAIGITVAKLGEAEVLADAGLGPILMANQVVGTTKIDRLMALLARGVDITTAVESDFNIDELVAGAKRSGQRPAAVIEVDAGLRRCGSPTPAESVRLARRLVDEGIDYRGIMGYEGHMYGQPEDAARAELIHTALATVNDHVEALAEAGLAPKIVSTSGTASVLIASKTAGVTELQAGTYVFNDSHNEEFIPGVFENALTLLMTVISVKDRYAVGDAGAKSLTNEFGPPMSVDGTVKVARLSEEHCTLTGEGIAKLKPGQRIEVVPSHGDTTLNQHDVYYVRRGEEVIDTWPILAARKFR
ncbi:MAG: alanine racemase [Dehalococcoidia bacterium]|uniref:alanine racemase n=1 Tax=Candidatus Amarobacter glycogenicus TaxID=3140699 RepID=UPI003134C7D8|nr:alanine racemase [Dehalococcoidia bacterium]MBK8559037.1 alanine racemase [Dehalococcoidia bacterium]MBK9546163.1 alanine racemase [Dehalococcoidia bacterium]